MKKAYLLIIALLSMFVLTSCAYKYTAPKDVNVVSSLSNPNIKYDSDFVQVVLFTYPNNTQDASLFVRKGTVVSQQEMEKKLDVKFQFPYSPKDEGNYWKDKNGKPFDFSKPITQSTYLFADYYEQDIKIVYDLNPNKNSFVKNEWVKDYKPTEEFYISNIRNLVLPSSQDIDSPGAQLSGWLYNDKLVPIDFSSLKNKIIISINSEREKAKEANGGKYDPNFVPTLKLVANYLSKPYNVVFKVPKEVDIYTESGDNTGDKTDSTTISSGQLPPDQKIKSGGVVTLTPYTYNTVVDPGGFSYLFKGWIYVDPSGVKHIIDSSNYLSFIINFASDSNNTIIFVPYIVVSD